MTQRYVPLVVVMRPKESLVCTAPPSRSPILHAHLDHARRVTRAVARGRVDRRFLCPVHDGQRDRRPHRHLRLGHRPSILGGHPNTKSCCRSTGRGNHCRHRGVVAGTGIRGDRSGEHEFATDCDGHTFSDAEPDVNSLGNHRGSAGRPGYHCDGSGSREHRSRRYRGDRHHGHRTAGDAGYRRHRDRDGDGVGCES
ncbi:excalibur calcium-binding domain-containing protein [Cryobacterium ruanii]|uniref:Excalibur calcium-binding domain-containing protein n=1 Tax=Cryobacterium ruanii TaxID=1259197 RepID=A0A4R9AMY2_9MICO|nr:excalibur calcium-binding domain-containing protein [Cryobacterium ruanii]